MPQIHNRIKYQVGTSRDPPSSDEEGWRSERRGGAGGVVLSVW
jgi:hypothetical protein